MQRAGLCALCGYNPAHEGADLVDHPLRTPEDIGPRDAHEGPTCRLELVLAFAILRALRRRSVIAPAVGLDRAQRRDIGEVDFEVLSFDVHIVVADRQRQIRFPDELQYLDLELAARRRAKGA